MKIRSDIEVDAQALEAFCRRHGIRHLALFLVEFHPGQIPGLLKLAAMELELAELFGGREVDLRTAGDLSPHFRRDVQSRAVPLYAAA